jgi:glucose-6-phosphate 1-dehydrogenase
MEPPVRTDSETVRDEKVKVLKAIPSLQDPDVIRGQFRGYRAEPGVAKDSKMETFAALRLEVDSWRWRGVPFFLRAGKCLPVTCTEVLAKFKLPPTVIRASRLTQNHLRFRISPDVDIAMGMTVMASGEEMVGESAEMLAHHHPEATEMDAYERVLGDAMAGDAAIFARQDYVEEAWRIVDPILKLATPAYEYEPGTWGPKEAATHIAPPSGWVNPVIGGPASAATAGSFK